MKIYFTALFLLAISTTVFAAQGTINNGETFGQARTKINDNFTDLYNNKADKTNISFLAGTLTDLKILTTAQPVTGEAIVTATPSDGTKQAYTAGQVDTLLFGKQTADAALNVDAIEFVIDGGGSAITTGIKGALEVPYAATINRATLTCDQSGSIVIDIWKDTFANFPPLVADTITASAKPTLSSAQTYQDSTLTGWTTSVAAGDWLRFNVDSATTVTRCTISLKVAK